MNNIRVAQKSDGSDDEPPPPPSASMPEEMPHHQIPTKKDGTPTDKAQRNFTDPQSRIMKTNGGGFEQGYNAQAAVDEEHQIIVAVGVSNQCPDPQHLIPMVDRIVENLGAAPARLSADTGYFSETNIQRGESRGIDLYIAVGRTKHDAATETAIPVKDENHFKARMKRKLSTPEGKKIYSRRKVIVEPVFGQIKNRGFRNFLLRGLEKVRGEWSLIALSHNLLKLFGFQARQDALAA